MSPPSEKCGAWPGGATLLIGGARRHEEWAPGKMNLMGPDDARLCGVAYGEQHGRVRKMGVTTVIDRVCVE